MDYSFSSFVDGSFDYDLVAKTHRCLWLREKNMDIGGGRISNADIDKLKDHSDIDTVTISGLSQDTFEYFIKMYGKQFKAIRFFKNKFIEDLSPLGTLPQLEYIYFFANQRITSLWDMSRNVSLAGLCIEDFSRLSSVRGIECAPALKDFRIGNAIWSRMVVDSLMPLSDMKIERLTFSGRAIADNDLSFVERLPHLRVFDFATNLFTTEQVAWIAANFPQLEGYALKPACDCMVFESNENLVDIPAVMIVGKKKPILKIKGNETKIEQYIQMFEALKRKYEGISYRDAFLSR